MSSAVGDRKGPPRRKTGKDGKRETPRTADALPLLKPGLERLARLAHAGLEGDGTAFAGQQTARDLPAEDHGASRVGLSGKRGVAIGAGAAGDVFQPAGQAVGHGKVTNGLAARVAVSQRERDHIADLGGL